MRSIEYDDCVLEFENTDDPLMMELYLKMELEFELTLD